MPDLLDAVFRRVEGRTIGVAAWYFSRRRWPGRWSRALRVLAVVFGAAGGLIPLVHAARPTLIRSEWGFVLLGMAGASVALDTFFGFSKSWMRFVATGLAIERQLESFQIGWAIRFKRLTSVSSGDTEEHLEMAEMLIEFADTIAKLVEVETSTWSNDLVDQIGRLERRASTREIASTSPDGAGRE